MGDNDDTLTGTLSDWITWCRSGEPQRKAVERQGDREIPWRVHRIQALCAACGAGCRESDDGLCWRCRQKRRYHEDAAYREHVKTMNRLAREARRRARTPVTA